MRRRYGKPSTAHPESPPSARRWAARAGAFWLLALAAIAPGTSGAQSAPAPPGAADPTIAVAGAAAAPADSGATAAHAMPTPAPPRAERPPAAVAPAPPSAVGPPPEPPADLRHVADWTAYRGRRHLASLPIEARLFYRRGLIAREAGQAEEALINVRGAAELDPTFVEPHLTLASWMLTRDPSQALQQYAAALELVRQDFNLQVELLANAFLIGYQALFAGLLFAAIVVVWLRRDEVSHVLREYLARFGTRGGSRIWAPALLVLPYFAGFGLTIPTVGFLAFLWPSLRARERALSVLLVLAIFATPAVLRVSERLALPLRSEDAPFYGVNLLEKAGYSPEREGRLSALAARPADNPLLQFGYAWTARRSGHLKQAEAAYRRAVATWPQSDRAWNNLGNVLAMQGRGDDAIACYKKAIEVNASDAAPYYNMAQLLTQRYDYQAATDALARASALNFELVRGFQAQATADGLLPLIDEWLDPQVFWDTLRHAPIPGGMAGVVPVTLRLHVEASGWPYFVLVVFAASLGGWAGWWQHRRIHLRACSNCGTTVCRRCAQRRREHALCPGCAEQESQGETPEFARLLLLKRRQGRQRGEHLVNTALAALIPGYGLLACRRAITPILLLTASWLIALSWNATAAPFAIEPRLTLPGQEVPLAAIVCGIVVVYTLSLLGFFRLTRIAREREASLMQATSRGRVQQSTRRSFQTAA